MNRKSSWPARLCLGLGLLALAAAPAAAQSESGSYGYVRTVEGSALLTQAGSREQTPADVNQPLLAGDRISVPKGSTVELVLADRNLVRLDGGSELRLEHLAASPDADDPATVLRLDEGNMQVVVVHESLGDELPRLETPNATILPQDFGVYRVTTVDQGSWTELTVRRGKAEVETDGDTKTTRADQRAVIEMIENSENGESTGQAAIDVQPAGSYDRLERWAERLDEDMLADSGDVDDDLRYSAAPLNRYGSWITVDETPYWRPAAVEAGWRPYSHGRWVYTPSGITWVSYEPWGWVPFHYGSWDYLPDYGWLWRAGSVYSPAWVYWYWGASYTGWCPIGYYTHYYSARFDSPGFNAGLYGWAGGDWGAFADWTFVPGSYFNGYRNGYRDGFRAGRNGRNGGWRDQWDVRRYAVPVDRLRRSGPLERGLITTDTRPLTPQTVGDPRRVQRVLSDLPTARRIDQGGGLPDVTPFIARRPDLPANVARIVVADRNVNQIDGTPLRPGTLGRHPRTIGETPRPVPGTPRLGTRIGDGDQPAQPGGRTPRLGRTIPGPQDGAPRPDRSGGGPRAVPANPDQTGLRAPRLGTPRTPQTPRTIHPDAPEQSGAPRPDRGASGRQRPAYDPQRPPSRQAEPPRAGGPALRPYEKPAPRPDERPTPRPSDRPSPSPSPAPRHQPEARPAPQAPRAPERQPERAAPAAPAAPEHHERHEKPPEKPPEARHDGHS